MSLTTAALLSRLRAAYYISPLSPLNSFSFSKYGGSPLYKAGCTALFHLISGSSGYKREEGEDNNSMPLSFSSSCLMLTVKQLIFPLAVKYIYSQHAFYNSARPFIYCNTTLLYLGIQLYIVFSCLIIKLQLLLLYRHI